MQKTVMHRASGYIRVLPGRILFMGVSLQIFLGLLWMGCSFNDLPQFPDSIFYMEISTSLKCDEYTGILYPFLLMLANGMENLIGFSYPSMLYLLQITFAFVSGYCFVGAVISSEKRIRFWKVWGSLALMTYPFAMQCHMAILPNSLAYSCFLFQVSCSLEYIKNCQTDKADVSKLVEKKYVRRVIVSGLCWILSALLLPEYLYFGVVPAVVTLLYSCIRSKDNDPVRNSEKQTCKNKGSIDTRKLICGVLLFSVCIGVIIGLHSITRTEGSLGKVHRSSEAAWFRRTAWSSLDAYYPDWPLEVKEAVSPEDFTVVKNAPENMKTLFQPLVEETLGTEGARAWFGSFGKIVFFRNYRQILEEIGEDIAGYLLPPVVNYLRLEGKGYASYSARNYEIMRNEHPLLTRYYIDYSAWWFGVAIVMIVLKRVGAIERRLLFAYRKMLSLKLSLLLMCMGSTMLMIGWYTLQEAGLWDPKKALFAGGLWMILMVADAMPHRYKQTDEQITDDTGELNSIYQESFYAE